MTTAIETTSTVVGAEVEFHFEDGVTQKDYDKIVTKVQRHIDKSAYPTSALFFADHKIVRVIFTYTLRHWNKSRAYDELGKPLMRLIDSHKQVAFYSWSL